MDPAPSTARPLPEALIAYAAFCALSLVTRAVPAALPVLVFAGILFPLGWAWRRDEWVRMGFARRTLGAGLAWGLLGGLAAALIGFLTVRERALAPDLWRELAVGVPLTLLLAVPFQEFFSGAGSSRASSSALATRRACWSAPSPSRRGTSAST